MYISFATPELRDICNDHELAIGFLGTVVAQDLQQVLSDLSACVNGQDIIAIHGEMAILLGDGTGAVKFGSKNKLVIRQNHSSTRLLEDHSHDWSRTTRIQIVSIEGLHE